MSIIELVNKLRERKIEGKFVDMTVENVWGEFIAPTLGLLGWDRIKPTGLNTINPFIELGGALRVAMAGGRGRPSQARINSEVFIEIAYDTHISIITNFDEWEILFKDYSKGPIAELRAEEFVSADGRTESEVWHRLIRLAGRQAVESGAYLHVANQLHQQRVDEQEIDTYVRELNKLREMIGDFLISNPREISEIKRPEKKRAKSNRSAYQIMGISLKREDRERDEALLNHVIQRLIDRFIIFRFAEDNEILVNGKPKPLSDLYYSSLLGAAAETLKAQDTVWRQVAGLKDKNMGGLFGKFARAYNGGVFEPLEGEHPDRINELPLNDELVRRIVELIVKRPVKKKLARLLGYIYEKYIGQRLYIIADPTDAERVAEAAGLTAVQARALRDRLRSGPFVRLENTPEKKRQAIYYTPEDVTRYITEQTVGALLDRFYDALEAAKAMAGAERVKALMSVFEKARELTVLDPSCGSGAFLIEALGLLRRFYGALGRAMSSHLGIRHAEMIDGEIIRRAASAGASDLGEALVSLKSPGVFALNWNIYGVDIDPRAVEICSVSLMIQVIEELVRPTGEVVRFPSIMGENIKRGNSALCDLPAEGWRDLFASKEKEIADLVELRKKVKDAQDDETRDALREQIQKRTTKLSAVVPKVVDRKYHPLNWPLEFPEIFFGPQGGFAVVIGNPPYADIKDQFPPELAEHRYKTANSGDLYTLMVENIMHLTSTENGCGGMIVPLSLTFSRDMISLRESLTTSNRTWKISSYASRPSSLFPGVEQRVCIALMSVSKDRCPKILASPMKAWFSHEREHLFESLRYTDCSGLVLPIGLPRIGSDVQAKALRSLFARGHKINDVVTGGGSWTGGKLAVHFSRTAGYYLSFSSKVPPITDATGRPSVSESVVHLKVVNEDAKWASLAILNGYIMLWFWFLYDDAFHVGKQTIRSLPVSPDMFRPSIKKQLIEKGKEIQTEMERQLVYTTYSGKRIGSYDIRKCRKLTDKVDKLIAEELELGTEFLNDIRQFCASTVRMQLTEHDEDSA